MIFGEEVGIGTRGNGGVSQTMQRIPALDGLRALAIAMVAAYHADKGLVPAGFWGVLLFFVLSGFLITRLLCAETDESGRLNVKAFYTKRAVRLFPALIVLCLVLVAAGTHWSTVVPALGYYANYARVAGVDLELLTHTWSLAVEEHFYLLWPLVIVATPARLRLRVIGFLAVAAIAWRALAIGVMSPGWVYNATDTNAAALLVGCYLGAARLPTWRHARWAVPAMLGLMMLPVFGEEGAAFLWGGFVAIGLGAFAIQYAMERPVWLEGRIIVWLGKISYGLYLWHYVFMRIDIPIWLAVVSTIAVAAASWYLVEEPIRRLREQFEQRSKTRATARIDRIGVRVLSREHS